MMNTKNNNLIASVFGLLALFVFALSPKFASAQGGFYMLEASAPVTVQQAKPAPTVVTQAPTKKKVAAARVTTQAATQTFESTGDVLGASDSLSANALSSTGAGLLPHTLLGWLLLCILILLAVKLWRAITVTEKEKNAPLKHA
jgi:hypothetical protein